MDRAPDRDTELDRLAALSQFNYEKERKDAAKKLGVRVQALDDEVQQRRPNPTDKQPTNLQALEPTEPWTEAVDGAQLLADIVSVLLRFMVLSREQAIAVALWIIFAHAHDAAEHSPILAIQSPEKRCGKTTLLQIIARLVPIDISAANITTASIFRTIEAWRPTLLLDEGDTYLKQSDEMRGVLNSGFSRASAYVIRTVGDNHEPKQFATWCPKVIALIAALPDTLRDRSIPILLRRKLASEKPERFSKRHHRELDNLCAKSARWANDYIKRLDSADPNIPDDLNDRAQDCWRPLLAVADAIAGEWSAEARRVALVLAGSGASDQSESAGVLLLGHIREIFEMKGVAAIKSSDLANALNANEEWPWCEWRGGREISTRGVAALLKPYGIRPHKQRNANEYVSSDFEDAWDRYLDSVVAPDTPVVSSTTSTDHPKHYQNNSLNEINATSTSSTTGDHVEDAKSTKMPVDTGFVEHVEHEAGVRPNGHAHVDDTDIVEVWI